MKFLSVLAFVSAPAFAEEEATATAIEMCSAIGEAAELTLEAHYLGVPLSEVMKLADGNKLISAMVLEAYDQFLYSDPEVQAEEIFDFRTRWELLCFENFN